MPAIVKILAASAPPWQSTEHTYQTLHSWVGRAGRLRDLALPMGTANIAALSVPVCKAHAAEHQCRASDMLHDEAIGSKPVAFAALSQTSV